MKTIELTQGKVALVDDQDYEMLSKFEWCAARDDARIYAASGRGTASLKMHSLILCPPDGYCVDHIDGNGLNNQRNNLRLATTAQNCRNRRKSMGKSSRFKGVHWCNTHKKWIASIRFDYKGISLGTFHDEDKAAMAYDVAAIQYFKEFALVNFPNEKHILARTRCYTIGHMEYKDGQAWRKKVESELGCRGITFFNPYEKPFLNDVPENVAARKRLSQWMKNGEYDLVAEQMRAIRCYDLRLVDLSDFLIAYIDPTVVTYGTIEELTTAVREKKPLFVCVEGGKKKCPLWILGMIPPKYVYNSIDEAIEILKGIDSGTIELSSDKWKLLKPEYR